MTGWISSHYRILGKVGSGGVGAAYEAEDTRLDATQFEAAQPQRLAGRR